MRLRRSICIIKNSISQYEAYIKFISILDKYINKYDKQDKFFMVGYNSSSLGMQLSDNFRALNPWFLLKMDGVDKYARLIQQNIDQAYYLAELIEDEPVLELMTPCTLNVVCFRFVKDGLCEDELTKLNEAIWWRVYQKGYFFSDTVLDGKFSLRVCITNHRTKRRHLDDFVMELVKAGKELAP